MYAAKLKVTFNLPGYSMKREIATHIKCRLSLCSRGLPQAPSPLWYT